MPREVKIVVKNVYAPTEQQQFIVQETAVVQHLKQLVHEQFPGSPLPAHQKLIFGGKICADSDSLQTILNVNQVQSEECADEAPAVVFHLLVTSAPPRSRPNTPPATASESMRDTSSVATAVPAPASPVSAAPTPAVPAPARVTPTLNRVSSDVLSGDRAAIDSPRPAPAVPMVTPPAMHIGSAATAPSQLPAATAAFAFPAFDHHAAPAAATAAAAQSPSPPSAQHHELFTQGMLMHQQALILAQIQYLQYLQHHAQQTSGAGAQHPVAPPHPQPHHAFAPYGHFGHYFGMGMHHQAHVYNGVAGGHAAAAPGAGGHHHHAGHHAGHHAAAAAPAPAAADATPRVPPLPVQLAREILPLFDLRLALKMAFMLFIIGQDTPNDRVLMLALLSFISYLHITGILAKVYEVYKRYYAPVAGDANGAGLGGADAANNDNNNNNNNNAVAGAGANADGAIAVGPTRLDLTRVLRISSDRGFVQDVKSFVVGFVLSLVPAWHPQPLHGGAAAPVQDLPDVAEMPVQGI